MAKDSAGACASIEHLADYAQAQRSTGLLVAQAGRTLVERSWPLGEDAAAFAAAFARGTTADGAPREDVASQQKSLIGLLVGVATDRGLLDVAQPVSSLIGEGWSKAARGEERAITVRHLLQMNSGLAETLTVEAPPGSRFYYNTRAYARLQRVLEAVSGEALGALSQAWLTGPLGMTATEWRARPAAIAEASGNAWGLVTTPRDLARLGCFVLDGGSAPDGTQLISPGALDAILAPTPTNPAYGWLWWLNGGDWALDAQGAHKPGPLLAAAPADLVLALGAQGRLLGVVPSRELIAVRLGPQPPDADFAAEFWRRVMAAAG